MARPRGNLRPGQAHLGTPPRPVPSRASDSEGRRLTVDDGQAQERGGAIGRVLHGCCNQERPADNNHNQKKDGPPPPPREHAPGLASTKQAVVTRVQLAHNKVIVLKIRELRATTEHWRLAGWLAGPDTHVVDLRRPPHHHTLAAKRPGPGTPPPALLRPPNMPARR